MDEPIIKDIFDSLQEELEQDDCYSRSQFWVEKHFCTAKGECIAARDSQARKIRSKSSLPNVQCNQVKVVLTRHFCRRPSRQKAGLTGHIISTTISDFSLNEEQSVPSGLWQIILLSLHQSKLLMHLGGMAGTGKSQVIKALISFFERRNQPYLFLILAPTGSAAALVDGSNLSLSARNKCSYASESLATMGNIRARIEQVEYVFLDEISMVDCGSLYTISAQMCMALQIDHKAFGGKNMIFCWRLCTVTSPGVNPPLYSHTVSTVLHNYPYSYSAEMD